MTSESALRIVVLREGDGWAAQCLEYDIAVQADDLDSLRERREIAKKAAARRG